MKRFNRVLLVMVWAVGLSACAAALGPVKTWEGKTAGGVEPAMLAAPGSINVKRVNDKAMGNFLMKDLALDYQLLPGPNRIEFVHHTLWAKGQITRNDESPVHVVETPLLVVTLDAVAGETYTFQLPRASNHREAQVLAANFSAQILDSAGRVVAEAMPADQVAVTPAADTNTLGALKQLWQQATEEERRAFLRWTFE
ncbi:MAG: DUF2057 domain-containing protein [Marinobacter sp.]|nr:DUF2057 domain-containing protein [Marinobacter sp.]